MQEFLGHLVFIEKYFKSPARPTISVADLTLSFIETYQWIFSGLNVNISRCCLDSIRITIKSDSQSNDMEHLVENPKITIFNSSFGILRSNPQTEAQITNCYIDAQFKPRPTLIIANKADVSIQNCHFGNFINENGSTVLCGGVLVFMKFADFSSELTKSWSSGARKYWTQKLVSNLTFISFLLFVYMSVFYNTVPILYTK